MKKLHFKNKPFLFQNRELLSDHPVDIKKKFLNLLYQINQFDNIFLKNNESNGPFCAHAIIEKICSNQRIGNSFDQESHKNWTVLTVLS